MTESNLTINIPEELHTFEWMEDPDEILKKKIETEKDIDDMTNLSIKQKDHLKSYITRITPSEKPNKFRFIINY
jgi:hypothetical protein